MMLTEIDVAARARKVFSMIFGSEDMSELDEDSHLMDDFGLDSLELIEVIMGLEVEFDVEISDEDAERIVTFGDVVTYILANA